jgi:hypothetical protein
MIHHSVDLKEEKRGEVIRKRREIEWRVRSVLWCTSSMEQSRVFLNSAKDTVGLMLVKIRLTSGEHWWEQTGPVRPTIDKEEGWEFEKVPTGSLVKSEFETRHPAAIALFLKEFKTGEVEIGIVFSGRYDGNGGASRVVLKVHPNLFMISLSSSASATARNEWNGNSRWGSLW